MFCKNFKGLHPLHCNSKIHKDSDKEKNEDWFGVSKVVKHDITT